MIGRIATKLLLIGSLVVSIADLAQAIPAFSGAEGPGGNATGGRGGDVYHVTSLDFDLNGTISGTLKYGITTAPANGRTIVFDVGGTIFQNGGGAQYWFRSSKNNITIAGQTAPGGVTIAGTGAKFTGNNNVLRNVIVRPNKDPVNPTSYTYDSFSLQLTNSVVDHVSSTWFTDEGISLTDAGQNTTVQYATLGEGLNYDSHSFGSIIATEVNGAHYSYHHNLYAHNNSRMPRLGSATGTTGAVLNWSNNVIYNWQNKAGYSGTNQNSRSNFIGNYYIKGPNNGVTVFDGGDADGSPGYTQLYAKKTAGLANKFDIDKDGVLFDGVEFAPGDTMPNGQKYFAGNSTFVNTPFTVDGVATPDLADVALQRVLDYGGANWQSRNPIDQRIINSVKTGTGGLINDLTTGVQVSEWATVMAERPDALGNAPYVRPAGFDTDQDGMPGSWEAAHNLDPNTADNNGDFDSDGYTNLEEYINEIAEWPAPAPLVFNAGTNTRYAQITNWDADPGSSSVSNWQPSKFDEVQVNSGIAVVDAVGQHAGVLKIAANSGDAAQVNIAAGWLRANSAVVIGGTPTSVGTLNLTGGTLSTPLLAKGAAGVFNFTGGRLQADVVNFDLTNNGGVLAPGNSPGNTTINGNFTANSGTLEIELASTAIFDTVTVSGNVSLGGALTVLLLDGYSPSSADQFTILTGGAVNGTFDNLSPTSRVNIGNGSGSFLVTIGAGGVVLSDFASILLPGDYNSDGTVDAADYVVWRHTLGQTGAGLAADGNGNSAIDSGDYDVWNAHFGQTAGSGSSAATNSAVPEPATFALFIAGLLAIFRPRHAGQTRKSR